VRHEIFEQKFTPAVVEYKKRANIHFFPSTKQTIYRSNIELSNPTTAKDVCAKTLDFITRFV